MFSTTSKINYTLTRLHFVFAFDCVFCCIESFCFFKGYKMRKTIFPFFLLLHKYNWKKKGNTDVLAYTLFSQLKPLNRHFYNHKYVHSVCKKFPNPIICLSSFRFICFRFQFFLFLLFSSFHIFIFVHFIPFDRLAFSF